MRTIEAQIHDILLDLLPDQYSNLSQAKIIAEATSIYTQNLKTGNIKTAAKSESSMMKALWTALASLSLEEDFEFDNTPDYVDGYGLDPNQIVRSAVNNIRYKNNIKMSKIAMQIINDDDLSALMDNEDNYVDNDKYDFDDVADETRHRKDVFKSPGDPKHRTDSTVI
jgi:hypothetical protein